MNHIASLQSCVNFRLRFLILIGALFVSGWPEMLLADLPEQTLHERPAKGFLLVASPKIADTIFQQTVILVTRHGNTGPVGVIINRPQDITLDTVFPGYPAAKDIHMFDGGPVFAQQVSYLVRGAGIQQGTLRVSENIFLAYHSSLLGELLSGKRTYTGLRVMHGLASWAPGQLEYEIKRGDWFVMPLDETAIFDRPPAELWQELQSHTAVM